MLLSLLDISEVELRLLYNIKLIEFPTSDTKENKDNTTENKDNTTENKDNTTENKDNTTESKDNKNICSNCSSIKNCCCCSDSNKINKDIVKTSNHSDSNITKNRFHTESRDILMQLQKLGCVSLSSFLLFISECISFDATLFCDYLCSPETLALKYLLRITKQLFALQSSLPSYSSGEHSSSSKEPSSSPHHSSVNIPSFQGVPLASFLSQPPPPSSLNLNPPFSYDSPSVRNCPELLDISFQTIHIKKQHIISTCNMMRPECSLMNPPINNKTDSLRLQGNSPLNTLKLNPVVAWVSNEKTTVIDEHMNDENTNDSTLWGDLEHFEQKLCPQEWYVYI
jgi:hypothetical protein